MLLFSQNHLDEHRLTVLMEVLEQTILMMVLFDVNVDGLQGDLMQLVQGERVECDRTSMTTLWSLAC